MWTGVSDHRPLWVEIKVLDGVKRKASKAKINNVRQTAAGLSKEEHIDEYQRIMMKFCEELVEPDNDQQTALQLEQISLKAVAVVNSILPPKSKKNLCQGWSPVLIALKVQLIFLTMVYRGLKTMSLEFKLRMHIRKQTENWKGG